MGSHPVIRRRGFVLAVAAVSAIVTCQWALADGEAQHPADGGATDDAVAINTLGATDELELPSGWRQLPELVAGMPEPLAGFDISHEAWGDPSIGAFLMSIRLSGPAIDDKGLHAALRGTLAKAGQTEISNQQTSEDGPTTRSQFHFRRGTLAGTVRIRSHALEGTISAQSAACFYNQRYPRLSEKQCSKILDNLIGSGPAPATAPALPPTGSDGSLGGATP